MSASGPALDLDRLARQTRDLDAARATGTPGATAALERHAATLAALHDYHPRPGLAHIAAHASERTSFALLYAGRTQHAQDWARRAAGLADIADDHDLRALAMLNLADGLMEVGHTDVAQIVIERARKGAGPWSLVRIEARTAAVNAQRGMAYESVSALDHMDVKADRAEGREPHPDWARSFGPAWVTNRTALTYQRLGWHKRAQRSFLSVLDHLHEPMKRAQVAVGIAECAAEQGRVDKASVVALEALPVLANGENWREVTRIRRLHARMPDCRPARQLGDALAVA